MIALLFDFSRLAPILVRVAGGAVVGMTLAVVVERAAFAWQRAARRRVEQRYQQIMRRALDGDDSAQAVLVASPVRHRLIVAALLIEPLIDDRDPALIDRTRAVVRAMRLMRVAERLLNSRRWWRRALALRALGLLQSTDHTARIVAALDDHDGDVRAAALDALADLQDPKALTAIVARLHDETLPRGRRGVALAAFGTRCEPFLLALAAIHVEERANYALALAICGTAASRPVLCRWTHDGRSAVRTAALQALGYLGLDDASIPSVLQSLEDPDDAVRAMAAQALLGWDRSPEAASRLGRHLHDTWTVAARAARSLGSMGEAGRAELRASAGRPDLAGVLARQMLWEAAR